MSNFDTFAPVTQGQVGTAPAIFVATTDELASALIVSGYIADKFAAGVVKPFDQIYITYDVDGTPGFGQYQVTATGGGSLIVSPAPGGGALLVANNLSDVANPATAAENLGLGVTDSPTFAGLTLTDLMALNAANAITAFAGGGQGSATALTAAINRVTTVATAADSVKLPAATAGKWVVVINAAAANAMNVFPQSGEVINALSADAAISVAANKAIAFFCAVNGTWNSILTA